MSRVTFLPGRVTAQQRSTKQLDLADLLRTATTRMAGILSARGLRARITLDSNSIVIGNQSISNKNNIEFSFASDEVFRKVFRRLRLFDFAMAYIDGQMKIYGPISDAVDVLDAMNILTDQSQTITEFALSTLFRMSKALIPKITRRFESLSHYAQNARAYELFLDHYMQYTCGYFKTGTEDIDQAQLAKFHLIERLVKNHSGPLAGKDHLDIGCGWGGMIAYFQSQFEMRSLGNTNCPQQMTYAQQRYRCDIALGDFSQLAYSNRRFDLITIVGMIEHLTPYRRSQLLNVVSHLLKENGVVYLQCIVRPEIWIGGDTYRLAQLEVFPGHFLETQKQTDRRLRNCGFAILEQLDHSHDYGLTTSRWVDNLQRNEEALINILGARQYHLYLGYMAFAAKLFSTGRGNLMRYVLKKI